MAMFTDSLHGTYWSEEIKLMHRMVRCVNNNNTKKLLFIIIINFKF